MPQQILAITTCRVSTPEQELNNSLGRQAEAVKQAAIDLGATIPEDGQWSGSVSSKVGKNVNRKDLKQMLEYCKKHTRVKYLIVHEVDRFMRSIEELFFFEVTFKGIGVKIIYASQPELNTNDHNAKLLKALEAFKSESSNVERIHKSISGHITALKQGRYTFGRKVGYKKGPEAGVKIKHPTHGPILQGILLDIYYKRRTPSQALVDFNKSEIMKGRYPYKMDKFKKVVIDPYNAGVVEMDKQIKYRNEHGRHEPLITLEQHYELVRIMSNRKKYQNGPRKNGNPEYPLSNLISCQMCIGKSSINRYVGFPHSNGKNPNLIYHKYRCRSCGKYITRDEVHTKINKHFKQNALNQEGLDEFLAALDTVWKESEAQSKQNTSRIKQAIDSLKGSIHRQAVAAVDPENASIKQELLADVTSKKQEVVNKENELRQLTQEAEYDKDQFLKFAYDFVNNMGARFLEIDKEDRLRCKQVVFPEGFYLDANQKVYTPKISPLITLQINKKDLPKLEKSLLVRVQGL